MRNSEIELAIYSYKGRFFIRDSLSDKSYSDKLLIGINRADLFRQGSCRNSDDSSRDELLFGGSIPLSVMKNNSKRHRCCASTARDCGSRDAH